jgi:hypothetical protein
MNIKAVQERLKKLQTTSNKSTLIWKPSVGENLIRIVPYQFDKENPFLELIFHYNVTKRSILSLETFGEADPIVEFANQLSSTGVKEDWIFSKKIAPAMRTFVPIIIREHEDEGVKFWGFGKEVYTQLLEFCADPDYGDISDLMSGRDVVVTYTAGVEGKTYPSTSIRVKPNPTKATNSKKVYELITNGQTDIYDIFAKPTYEELKTMLTKYLDPENQESETDSKPNKPETKKPQVDLSDTLTDDDLDDEPTTEGPSLGTPPELDDFDKLFEDE